MPTLINVLGPGRTGSTVLDLMLGNGEDSYSIGEAYVYYWPWRKMHLKPECSCGEQECKILHQLYASDEENFHKKIFDITGAKYVIDSSKYLPWVLDSNIRAEKQGYDVVNILTWKQPHELCYSHWKRNRGKEFWKKRFMPYYTELFESKVPYVSVYAGDLVTKRKQTLNKLCKLTGIKYYDGKERFWEETHHFVQGSPNVREQYSNKKQRDNFDNYEEDFEPIKEQVISEVKSEPAIQNIIKTLEKNDVYNYNGSTPLSHNYSEKNRPLWYYREKILKPGRRYLAVLGVR